ncbi:hypothetical protein FGIG_07359 [Fasciola gigantica]|uniref:Uncharacterized protein n=1 Tax=Fasciola gigantica TaxID=46835 RepID=A0A504YRQ5_FASGI|nr:hypothetical protein FGIG_07359 [Fasciola gigantica]
MPLIRNSRRNAYCAISQYLSYSQGRFQPYGPASTCKLRTLKRELADRGLTAFSKQAGLGGRAAPNLGVPRGAENLRPTTHLQKPNSDSISEDQLVQSVRSAVLDKLRRCERELLMQHRDEIQSLQETQADLVRGGALLSDMLSRMDREKVSLHRLLSCHCLNAN